MSAPLISVLIDTYNYGHFIEEAVDSVLAQDFPPGQREIIIIDDGSTDNTGERVRKYGDQIQYFCKSNGGQASALNLGFEKARGEVIAFLDGDDYWLPGKLRFLSEEFRKKPDVGLVYHRLMEADEETGRKEDLPFSAISGYLPEDISKLLSYRVYPTSSLAFRWTVLQRLVPLPESMRLQADTYLGILAAFLGPVSAVMETLGVYRLHGKNLYSQRKAEVTEGRKREQVAMRREIIGLAHKWLVANGFDEKDAAVRAFFDQLMIFVRTEEFEIETPGRIRFFRFLMKCNRVFGPRGNWKLRSLNCANAVASLVVGYKGFPLLTRLEERVIRFVGGGASN